MRIEPHQDWHSGQLVAVSFDRNGTLVDLPLGAGEEAVWAFAEQFPGRTGLAAHFYRQSIKDGESKFRRPEIWIRAICQHLGESPSDLEARQLLKQAEQAWVNQARLHPGADDLLMNLELGNRRSAVCSNCTWAGLAITTALGLDRLTSVQVHSCEERVAKPDRRIYHTVAKRLVMPSNQIIHVEDDIESALGAKSAGMAACLVLHPNGSLGRLGLPIHELQDLANKHKLVILEDITEVAELL